MEEEFTRIWKALADPARRTILDLLRERPRTTGELCSAFEVSRYATMKHLAVLEQAGLITIRREGRERWNHLNAVPLQQISERWLKPYEAQWANSLLRMKRFVETNEERDNKMSETFATTPTINMMKIELEISIQAPPERVFTALTQDIAAWWDKQCSYGIGKMVLEPEVGKRFYEDYGNGEGALYGRVTYLEQNKLLKIEGSIGMERAVQGLVRYELVPQGESTLLKFSHHAFGDLADNTQANYTNGWKGMLEGRLRPLVERGE